MTLWYASRAAGLVSLLLLTLTTGLGITGPVGFATRRWPRFVLALLHRNVALLAVSFVAVHAATAVIDTYAGIRWVDTLVPFVSGYEPFWLGLGAVAGDLILALVVTSLLRARLGLRAWRAVHWAAYGCWPVAVVHAIGIGGQDIRTGWVLTVVLGCAAALIAAAAWRWQTAGPGTRVVR